MTSKPPVIPTIFDLFSGLNLENELMGILSSQVGKQIDQSVVDGIIALTHTCPYCEKTACSVYSTFKKILYDKFFTPNIENEEYIVIDVEQKIIKLLRDNILIISVDQSGECSRYFDLPSTSPMEINDEIYYYARTLNDSGESLKSHGIIVQC